MMGMLRTNLPLEKKPARYTHNPASTTTTRTAPPSRTGPKSPLDLIFALFDGCVGNNPRPKSTSFAPRYHSEPAAPLKRDDRHLGKKTLVVDLDETLIHSSELPIPNADFSFQGPVGFHTAKLYVKFRPGAREFLQKMNEYYEVMIFTASCRDYASVIVDKLDPDKKLVAHLLCRENCIDPNSPGGHFIKDLERLGRPMSGVIILDDCDISFKLQPENGLLIKGYDLTRNPEQLENDTELLDMMPFLEHLAPIQDVRPISKWRESFDSMKQKSHSTTQSLEGVPLRALPSTTTRDPNQETNNDEQK